LAVVYDAPVGTRLLNPEIVRETGYGLVTNQPPNPPVRMHQKTEIKSQKKEVTLIHQVDPDPSVQEERFAQLLKPAQGSVDNAFPSVTFFINGKEVKPTVVMEKGQWAFYSAVIGPGTKEIRTKMVLPDNKTEWRGSAESYLICLQKEEGKRIVYTTISTIPVRPMLSLPFETGLNEKTVSLGVTEVDIKE